MRGGEVTRRLVAGRGGRWGVKLGYKQQDQYGALKTTSKMPPALCVYSRRSRRTSTVVLLLGVHVVLV